MMWLWEETCMMWQSIYITGKQRNNEGLEINGKKAEVYDSITKALQRKWICKTCTYNFEIVKDCTYLSAILTRKIN
jgi:hypothetical protein